MMVTAVLTCHSASVCPHIRKLCTQVHLPARDRLTLRFQLEGAIEELLVPQPTVARRVDGLWKHTCFEAFLRAPGSTAYYEFNFSPSGEWAAYRFDAYRSGMSEFATAAPDIGYQQTDDRVAVEVNFTLPTELTAHEQDCLLASATAVIEDRTAHISYWAVVHAPLKPDFHHDMGFVLRIPRSSHTSKDSG